MNVSTDLVIGAAILFVLNLARTAARRAARPNVPGVETFLPATTRPPAIRIRIRSDPAPSIPIVLVDSGARGRHVLDAVRSDSEVDPTDAMMAALRGPGVCTPSRS